MNLFDDIQVLDDQIKDLTWKLKYSKSKDKDVEVIKRLTVARNNYSDTLNHNYYFDSLDALIFSLMINLVSEKGTPLLYNMDLQHIHNRIISVLQDGGMQKREQLIQFLKVGWEAKCLERYKDHQDKEKLIKDTAKMTEKYCDKAIKEITNKIKDTLQWIK